MDIKGHVLESGECPSCWKAEVLTCVCGGRLHTEFGDYTNADEGYYLEKACEKCDDSEEAE